jgi:hypothetical protein
VTLIRRIWQIRLVSTDPLLFQLEDPSGKVVATDENHKKLKNEAWGQGADEIGMWWDLGLVKHQ